MIVGNRQIPLCDNIHSNNHILRLTIHRDATIFNIFNHKVTHLQSYTEHIGCKRLIICAYKFAFIHFDQSNFRSDRT